MGRNADLPNADWRTVTGTPNAEVVPNAGWPAFACVGVVGGESVNVGALGPNALTTGALGCANGDDELIAAPPNAPNPESNLVNPVGCCLIGE